MTTPRDLITRRIARQARLFPELDIAAPDVSGLSTQDAALAIAIDHAVNRHWLTLVAVAESHLSRSWDDLEFKLQAALLVGVAQLLFMDRLPDHAVINEAVQWAKDNVRPKAGGLVNAVLRKVAALRAERIAEIELASPLSPLPRDVLPLHDGRAWRLAEPVFDENPLHRLAQQTSHPEHLIRQWQEKYSDEVAMRLALHSLIHPPIIIAGTTDEQPADDENLKPHDEDGFAIFVGPHDALSGFLAAHPGARVQDPGAAAAVMATRSLRLHCIVDYCAGKGTKTQQLAALHPSAEIIATDVDAARLATLRAMFKGHDRVRVVGPREIRSHVGRADLLLLDVPCSNTGVLARRVEAKYRYSAESLAKLVNVQRQIVADAFALLADDGRILYSTCSIEPAENEDQAAWIARWHRMQIDTARSRLPASLPGAAPQTYSDGGYFAILKPGGHGSKKVTTRSQGR
ncbi:MAG: hypothetical protein JSV91_03300 [Phycisphaerales bacterium]|nr:MAG: hypothetical protein JSV91_03300 [Phycisphaerales bacterium]